MSLTYMCANLEEGFAIDKGIGYWPIMAGVSGVQGVVALKPYMPCWHLQEVIALPLILYHQHSQIRLQ